MCVVGYFLPPIWEQGPLWRWSFLSLSSAPLQAPSLPSRTSEQQTHIALLSQPVLHIPRPRPHTSVPSVSYGLGAILFFAYLFPSIRSTPQNSTSQLQSLLHLLQSPHPIPPGKVTPSLHDAPSWGGIVQVVGTADAWHGDIEDARQGISVKLQD